MNKKINYIGTIEDPEITEIKKKYIRMSSEVYDYFRCNNKLSKKLILIAYMDQKYIQQFRREILEKIDEHTFRVQQMTFVKDNMQEGESIHIIWE